MITKRSIDLKRITEPCFGKNYGGGCSVLVVKHKRCGTYLCPFYKPKDCKAWIRIEDRQGINLIPPEEAFGKR